jgi:hypothetical protein
MRQKLEQQRAVGQGPGKAEAAIEPDLERFRPQVYSVDEDVKAVFDRFREASAARHALAVLRVRKIWGEA